MNADILDAIQDRLHAINPAVLPIIAPVLEEIRIEYGGDSLYIKKSKAMRKATVRTPASTSREVARRNYITRRTAQLWARVPS